MERRVFGIHVRDVLDAALTYDLLVTIFQPGSPLHDGAAILQDNRVAAAACFLPLTTNPRVNRELGSRHRAAIGVTEENDSIAIVDNFKWSVEASEPGTVLQKPTH